MKLRLIILSLADLVQILTVLTPVKDTGTLDDTHVYPVQCDMLGGLDNL